MKRYMRIYRQFLALSLSKLMAYPANFVNEIIGSIVWGAFAIISVLLLTSKSGSVYGWSREELLILTASFGVVWGIFHMLFIRNFSNLSYIVDYGVLDGYLLKPIDSQFITTTQIINYPSFIRIAINAGLLIYYILGLSISLTVVGVLSYLILIIFGVVILYAIFFISTTILIWNPRLSNILEVMYTVSAFSRYPPEMFKTLPSIIFLSILPLTFVVVTPTKALLNKLFLGDVFGLILSAFILFLISRLFWRFALRHYSSASS